MKFLGLFIGIDRYESADISELSCARQDALALQTLFLDTLGGEAKLLVDEKATKGAIEDEFQLLREVDEEDVVVIGFSGHGSKTHQLVTHDTQLRHLEETAIPLDTLATWFSQIPSRHVVLFLDCCFSGGLGAKVLQTELVPRDIRSTDAMLNQLSGRGRLILTASAATEPAWEKAGIGHGLLTYYLLEALQGIEEVQQAGKVSIYRLLEYVTQKVKDSAGQLGATQNPTLRGQLDGELTWPIFKPGKNYFAAFPQRAKPRVTAEIESLSPYGFPEPILEAWRQAIPSLNQLQIDAVNEFNILSGEHLVVSAPTSSGKTMIGELAAIKGALSRKKTLFLLPLKALVYDKQRYFQRLYGDFGIRTIEATGETDDIGPLLRGKYDICLLTYEKLSALVLGNPHVLDQVSTIVIDEVQMIADDSRGANLEFLMTLLLMRRHQGNAPQIIALSAVIGDTNGFERWLGARLLRRLERPVRLEEGILLRDGSFRYLNSDDGEEGLEECLIEPILSGKNSSQDYVIPLVLGLVDEGQQVIVFREIKGETRGCANYLARDLHLPPATAALKTLPSGDLSAASQDLRNALESGVAFHNADLDRDERLVIEEQFRAPDTKLRVIVATTTLAMGVNTPASSVVIVGLTHPGAKPYSVAEYKNLVGRAGRLGFTEKGRSFLIAKNDRSAYDYWERYVLGQPEDLRSRFLDEATDPRTLILRVLTATRRYAPEGVSDADIVQFLESSFGAFQLRQRESQWSWNQEDLFKALADLESHALVERNEKGFFHITELGKLPGEGGCEVSSIVRLIDCLRPLAPEQISDPTLIAVTQATTELDDVYFPINKSSKRKEPFAWPSELRNQGVPSHVLSYLQNSAQDRAQSTRRSKKAVACLLFIGGESMGRIEQALGRFGGAFGGVSGPIRSTSSRTCDLLPMAARVAEILNPELDLPERLNRLLVRLESGLPAAVAELALHTGRAFSRADYFRLQDAGFVTLDALEAADEEKLLVCVIGDEEKLKTLKAAARRMRAEMDEQVEEPLLNPYEA